MNGWLNSYEIKISLNKDNSKSNFLLLGKWDICICWKRDPLRPGVAQHLCPAQNFSWGGPAAQPPGVATAGTLTYSTTHLLMLIMIQYYQHVKKNHLWFDISPRCESFYSLSSCPQNFSSTLNCWMAQIVNWCRVWWKETTVFLTRPPCWSSWTPLTMPLVAGHTSCLRSVSRRSVIPKKEMIIN